MSYPLTKPLGLAELGAVAGHVEERLGIGEFGRLKALHLGDADVSVSVSGTLGPADYAGFEGAPLFAAEATVQLTQCCQRCLEPVEFEVHAPIRVVFVSTGRGAEDDAEFDVWELDSPGLTLADVAEEYLLLSLPVAPRHEQDDCVAAATADSPPVSSAVRRPFEGLDALLREGRLASEDDD